MPESAATRISDIAFIGMTLKIRGEIDDDGEGDFDYLERSGQRMRSGFTLDLDGDGITDVELMDDNKDGTFDVAAVDSDMDGHANVLYHDVNGDGNFDYAAFDSDGDGIMDTNVDASSYANGSVGSVDNFDNLGHDAVQHDAGMDGTF